MDTFDFANTTTFDYEEYKKHLDSILFKNNDEFSKQCSFAVLYGMLYEFIKFALIERVIDFYDDDFMRLGKSKKSKKYNEECSKAGGNFNLGYYFYNLNEKQIEIIEKAQKRRGNVVHEFLNFFIAGEHLTPLEIQEVLAVAKFLDNFHTVNIEMAIAGEYNPEEVIFEEAHSVYFIVLNQIAEKVLSL